MLLLLASGCGDAAGDGDSPGGADAGSDPRPHDSIGPQSTDDHPQPTDSKANGQTGSLGSVECTQSSECEEKANAALAALRTPAGGEPRSFVASECAPISVISEQGSAGGSACMCRVEGGGSVNVGPRGAGCFVYGRAQSCLWDDSEWDGCSVSDAHACDAVCDELAARYAADAADVFDAKLLTARCDSGRCRSAFEVEGSCYAGGASWSAYDCALGGDGILARAAADEQAAANPPTLPAASTLYADGSDGFVQLTVSHNFEGTEQVTSGFGAFSQFYAPIDGSEVSFGDVLDPLEGQDDCGVFRSANMGAGVDIHFRQVGEATLLDGSDEIPLAEFMSGDLFSYGAELERTPRFGERYGVHVAGGEFGAAFDSDRVELPLDLSVETLEQSARLPRADLTLHWTGSGSDPLQIRMLLASGLSDFGGELELRCLVKDDGEFTIPGSVLALVPDGIAYAYVTRARRTLQKGGGHALVIEGSIQNSYHFALSDSCDRSELRAACEQYWQAASDAYTSCGVAAPKLEELCPDYLFESCITCPEYFECKADQIRCDNGLYLGQCSCD